MMIGKMDRLVSLQRPQLAIAGDPQTSTWSEVTKVWAEKMDKGGAERYLSDHELSELNGVYRIRYYEELAPDWRLVDDGEIWDIEAIVEGRGRRWEALLIVTRLDPADLGDSMQDPIAPIVARFDILRWETDRLLWGSDQLGWQ